MSLIGKDPFLMAVGEEALALRNRNITNCIIQSVMQSSMHGLSTPNL
jgi:hypothetical protein